MSAFFRFAPAVAAGVALAGAAEAGAWLLPPGAGQIIAGLAFSGSNRAFDRNGKLIAVPSYQKFELGAYIEYGVAEGLTLVASPAFDHIRQPAPAASYDGLGESGGGGRIGLYQSDAGVAALQGVLLAPGASFNGGAQPRRAAALDLRALAGANVTIDGWPAFVDFAAGYRFYAQAQPSEWRLDATFGVRPAASLLLLAQSFGAIQTGQSAAFPRTAWEKLQGSVVYDFAAGWSAQAGAFVTVAGMNAGRELGPIVALWHRF